MRVPVRIAVTLWTAAALCVGVAVTAEAASYTPVSNPANNFAPVPDFDVAVNNPCAANSTLVVDVVKIACSSYIVGAISGARYSEGVKPLVLPTNWASLSVPQQLFVVVDLERVDRGYPAYLGMNAALDGAALAGAQAGVDPTMPSSFAVGSNAGGPAAAGAQVNSFNSLAADYHWLYTDGFDAAVSPPLTWCATLTATGCWAHRDGLLGWDPVTNSGVGVGCTTCEFGAGEATTSAGASYAVLVALPASGTPAMTFTWDKEKTYLPLSTTTPAKDPCTPPPPSTNGVPAAPMGACGVTVSKGHFVRGVATINWASAAGVSVDTVIFTVYATSRCTAAISATGQYWHADFPWVGVATNNKMQKARVGVTYYATITISNRQPPAVKSRCVTLGQFTR